MRSSEGRGKPRSFERILLESKKRLPEYVSQKPADLELRSQFRRTIKAPSSGRIGFYDQDSANSERGNAIEVSKRASSGRGSDPKIGQSDPYDPQRPGVRKRGGEGRSASLLHFGLFSAVKV